MFDKNNKLGDRMSSRDVPAFKNSLEWTTNTPEGGLMVRQLPNVFKCFCGRHPLPESPPYVHRFAADIPANDVLVSGVGRSGSTVVWQVVDLITEGRVLKSHSFQDCCPTMFKFKKVIITVRNPFDSVYSKIRINATVESAITEWHDIGRFYLLKNLQNSIGYRADMEIIFLKYEDFWNKDLERIRFLADFLNQNVNEEKEKIILADASIEKNFERSKEAAASGKTWGDDHQLDRKINPGHVDNKKGIPGQGKALDRFIKQDILDSCEWAFDEFGYSKDF